MRFSSNNWQYLWNNVNWFRDNESAKSLNADGTHFTILVYGIELIIWQFRICIVLVYVIFIIFSE